MPKSPVELMVVAPHPDDAEFGIAGTVAKITSSGKEVVYVIVTGGEKGTDDPAANPDDIKAIRRAEQLAAASVLGVSEVQFLDFADGGLEDSYHCRLAITREIRRFRPRVVASTDPYRRYMWHRDHRITGQVVADAVYPFARNWPAFPELIKENLAPHTVSRMLFWGCEEPNHFEDITPVFDTKLKALRCHRSQIGMHGDNNLEAWLHQRAADMARGQDYELAEAFRCIDVNW
ncbi:MAG: PIG-L family deacetylase [Dehalococcoidaceae bacterium]|nr:PIG-L family deacetylase [Dehalococcoidaceae bacterium]